MGANAYTSVGLEGGPECLRRRREVGTWSISETCTGCMVCVSLLYDIFQGGLLTALVVQLVVSIHALYLLTGRQCILIYFLWPLSDYLPLERGTAPVADR